MEGSFQTMNNFWLRDKVSIFKDKSLLLTAKVRRSLEKKDDSLPGSHRASTVMVSPSLTKVRELVSKVAEPKIPRFTQLLVHSAACPASSCRARPEA